jgi:hypothetical protein
MKGRWKAEATIKKNKQGGRERGNGERKNRRKQKKKRIFRPINRACIKA